MEDRKIRVAITHGDTNGIGYELIFKTFNEPAMLDICTPIVYGSPKTAAYHRNVLDMQANFTIIKSADEAVDGRINMLTAFDEEVKIDMGEPTKESGEAAIKALDRAMKDFQDGLFDVLVTTPMTMSEIKGDSYPFKSQNEYITKYVSPNNKPLRIVTNRGMRIAIVSNSPMAEICNTISKDAIESKANMFAEILRRDFRISQPRIAILSLNPKSEQNGKFGKEEEEIIKPAIESINEKRPIAFGPYAADEFFTTQQYEAFDGILAMYYDQAAAPFKLLSTGNGVCLTAGMPLVHTYSNHDCGFADAGKGTADETSFRDAIYLAIDIARNREEYDRPMANPLKKLYNEKRDDGDKNRFHTKDPKTTNTKETVSNE